jgi:hypothetical protein
LAFQHRPIFFHLTQARLACTDPTPGPDGQLPDLSKIILAMPVGTISPGNLFAELKKKFTNLRAGKMTEKSNKENLFTRRRTDVKQLGQSQYSSLPAQVDFR